ncbi:MAG: hypothetical protein ACI4LX_06020 [Treponema sp.]
MNNLRTILIGLITALSLYLIIYTVLFTICIVSNGNELIKKTDDSKLKPCLTESMQEAIEEGKKFSLKEEIELFKKMVAINENIRHQKLFQFVLSSLISIIAVLVAICILFVMLLISLHFFN